MEKNNEQVKNIWKPLCLVFAALLALSWVFFGFLYSKGGVDFSSLETPEQVQTDNGSPVTDENGEKLPSDETIPMPSALAFSSAAALDGETAAYDSVTLTATVKPDTATNKTVDWSVAFVNPSSAWASGKSATDYVTVTPTSDGSTTATVQCLKDFGEQIKITVTSRDNENAKASCTVDFRKRIVDLNLETADNYSISEEDKIITCLKLKDISYTVDYLGGYTLVYSEFTIDDTSFDERALTVTIADSFYQALKVSGLTVAEDSLIVEKANFYPWALGCLWLDGNSNTFVLLGVGQYFNNYVTAIQAAVDSVLGTVTFTFDGDNSSFEKTYSIKVDSSALVFSVESVSLDQSNVVI